VFGLDHVVLNVATDSMLRAEESSQIHLGMFMKKVSRVVVVMVHGSLIANQSHPSAPKYTRLRLKEFLKA
jgi:hypothetical protein